jgi:hypothetical protein
VLDFSLTILCTCPHHHMSFSFTSTTTVFLVPHVIVAHLHLHLFPFSPQHSFLFSQYMSTQVTRHSQLILCYVTATGALSGDRTQCPVRNRATRAVDHKQLNGEVLVDCCVSGLPTAAINFPVSEKCKMLGLPVFFPALFNRNSVFGKPVRGLGVCESCFLASSFVSDRRRTGSSYKAAEQMYSRLFSCLSTVIYHRFI